MEKRYWIAMGTYAAMAVLATVTLDGKLRYAVWVLMGALAIKTYIARRAGW